MLDVRKTQSTNTKYSKRPSGAWDNVVVDEKHFYGHWAVEASGNKENKSLGSALYLSGLAQNMFAHSKKLKQKLFTCSVAVSFAQKESLRERFSFEGGEVNAKKKRKAGEKSLVGCRKTIFLSIFV
jgi:hypothetical protein